MSPPNINFLHPTVSEILPAQNFNIWDHYDKVKGQIKLPHNMAHLHPPTNVSATCQLSTPYTSQDIASKRF